MKAAFETTVRVRYAETDQLGVVYHSNFFVWFEVGRVEALRELGFSYRDMEKKDDCHIVVAKVNCNYKKPARYDDVVRLRTHISEVRSRTIKFEYEVFNDATGDLLADGETFHVICDKRGRPKTLPEKYRRLLNLSHAAAARP
ncbi:MAG: acyl-CoA thioesterase [Acidobacteria bacterium]|nr:acyl-CoA thioesterase [Acidobacteriota bacterium]